MKSVRRRRERIIGRGWILGPDRPKRNRDRDVV